MNQRLSSIHICKIAFTVVSPRQDELGWPFANVDPFTDAGIDPNNQSEHVRDLYFKADPDFNGRLVFQAYCAIVLLTLIIIT